VGRAILKCVGFYLLPDALCIGGYVNELALFAGAGGGLLATTHLLKWRTVCYVEWDDYCISVLKQRIADGYLHDAPIWDDVRTFDGRPWAGCVDIVTAGFPCQPFSAAGKQQGEDDEPGRR
jgi:DNA (cytosine-5)-methyltransferase 1